MYPYQEERHARAQALLSAVIAVYRSRISRADPATAERLRADRLAVAKERTTLSLHQEDAVQRILREYPAVLQRLEEGAP